MLARRVDLPIVRDRVRREVRKLVVRLPLVVELDLSSSPGTRPMSRRAKSVAGWAGSCSLLTCIVQMWPRIARWTGLCMTVAILRRISLTFPVVTASKKRRVVTIFRMVFGSMSASRAGHGECGVSTAQDAFYMDARERGVCKHHIQASHEAKVCGPFHNEEGPDS